MPGNRQPEVAAIWAKAADHCVFGCIKKFPKGRGTTLGAPTKKDYACLGFEIWAPLETTKSAAFNFRCFWSATSKRLAMFCLSCEGLPSGGHGD